MFIENAVHLPANSFDQNELLLCMTAYYFIGNVKLDETSQVNNDLSLIAYVRLQFINFSRQGKFRRGNVLFNVL